MKSKFVAAAAIFGLTVVQQLGAQIGGGGETFNMDLFERNINAALSGKAIGWAYAITDKGLLARKGSGGYARLAIDLVNTDDIPDPNGIAQSPTKRMNIASVTKPLTATTVMRIIQDHRAIGYPDLTVDSKIWPFLPKNWVKGPGVDQLTFKEMLSQYSGMFDNGGATETASLKTWIATGVTRAKNEYIYINGNLAIFRILIPYMLGSDLARGSYDALEIANPTQFSNFIGDTYKKAVRALVLEPMGITNADMKPEVSPFSTLLYDYLASKPGTQTGDWTPKGGGGGWYLSAVDLARFMAYYHYSNSVIHADTRALMTNLNGCPSNDTCRLLGWQPPRVGEHGLYYFHGGGLKYGADPENGMSSVIIRFPNGVMATLLINSWEGYPDKKGLIIKAFDDAWQ